MYLGCFLTKAFKPSHPVHLLQPTSDLVDDQVHLSVGALAKLPNDLIVFIKVQLLQLLSSDELQLFQDVNGGTGHVGRGAHYSRDGGTSFQDNSVDLTI